MTWRSPKLLVAVRQLPCQWCGRDDGTVCAAHSNRLFDGKGRSLKASDYRIAALCSVCHAEIDQGKDMSREERETRWELAHRATIGAMFERGILKVTG